MTSVCLESYGAGVQWAGGGQHLFCGRGGLAGLRVEPEDDEGEGWEGASGEGRRGARQPRLVIVGLDPTIRDATANPEGVGAEEFARLGDKDSGWAWKVQGKYIVKSML